MSDLNDLSLQALLKLTREDALAESAAEITRLTEAIAAHEESAADKRRLVREIDAIMHGDEAAEQASLCDLVGPIRDMVAAIAASEEARRAERAAVVREARTVLEAEIALAKEVGGYTHVPILASVRDAILALATDADNAALDKLLREARMEGMERAALAVTERADQEDEFAAMHGELENNSKAREAARVVTTLRGVAAHIRILAALEAPQ